MIRRTCSEIFTAHAVCRPSICRTKVFFYNLTCSLSWTGGLLSIEQSKAVGYKIINIIRKQHTNRHINEIKHKTGHSVKDRIIHISIYTSQNIWRVKHYTLCSKYQNRSVIIQFDGIRRLNSHKAMISESANRVIRKHTNWKFVRSNVFQFDTVLSQPTRYQYPMIGQRRCHTNREACVNSLKRS